MSEYNVASKFGQEKIPQTSQVFKLIFCVCYVEL